MPTLDPDKSRTLAPRMNSDRKEATTPLRLMDSQFLGVLPSC